MQLFRLLLACALFTPPAAAAPAPEKEALVDEAVERSSHLEVEPLNVEFKRLSALCMHPDGRLLAADAETQAIKAISRAGRVVAVFKVDFGPEALSVAPDGTIYCGGEGKLARLDPQGRVTLTVPVPGELIPPVSGRRRSRSRGPRVSGMAVTARYVFAAMGSGWSLGSKSKLFRVDRDFSHPKVLADGIRGCCQRCDIVSRGNTLFVAENSTHRVLLFDFDGKSLGKWGARSRTGLEGFGSCCNPMNLCFDAGGILYTSESGMGRVKRYSPDGKFLGLVGYVGVERFRNAGRQASSCSNIAIAVLPHAQRVYVMDYSNNRIRVLQRFD